MRKAEKIRYEVDPFNRLIYAKTGRESCVLQFRTVLDGEFKVDKRNQLSYRVKKPSLAPTQQLKLSGNWSLDKEHNLIFVLDKENNQKQGEKLTLEGEIIDTKADALVFSLATKDSKDQTQLYLLKLAGRWQADKHNRLSFLVSQAKYPADELKLSGSWEINRQNQFIYTYTKTSLKTKDKLNRTLFFKGFWDITAKNRLSYVLSKEINSGFDFRVSLGKPLKRGLEYEIGVGASPLKKKFLLFGSWKISPRLGLLFEMPAEEGRIQRLIFGATCKLDKGYNLEFKLKNSRNEDLGMQVKLSRTILKGLGETYLGALKEGREISLVAGLGFQW